MHFTAMAARVGREMPATVETTVLPREQYRSEEYKALSLPCAPAIMVGDRVIVEGRDLADGDLIAAIQG